MLDDTLSKLAKKKNKTEITDDSVSKIIENGKSMGRKKPYNLDPLTPDKPEPAANDATSVKSRKLDNVLPTMNRKGVQDIVRNLSRK